MLASLQFYFIFLFQPDSAGSEAPATGATGAGPAGCEGGSPEVLMLLAMGAIFYFLLIRPQQRQARERDAMLKSIEKGRVVRTTGGIRGEVLSLEGDEVTLLVAPKVKLQVLRANIAGVVGADAKAEAATPEKGTKSSDG